MQRTISPAVEGCSVAEHDPLLSAMDLPFCATFYPLGYAVEIITNDSSVLEAAHQSFGHMRLLRASAVLQFRIGINKGGGSECPPEPARMEHNDLYSLIADGENEALLDLRAGTGLARMTQAAADNRLYLRSHFLEKPIYLLLGACLVTDMHAACVSMNGKGILLCGDSGAGKSTLAYGCARAGWTYTSDDTSYLINNSDLPRVIGHSHRARFRPAARSLFPELETRALTPGMEGKPSIEVPVSELPIRFNALEAEIHSIVYLNRYSSAKGQLVQLPEGTATRRMCSELHSGGETRLNHEQQLERLYALPTYELQYCGLEEAITCLNGLAH